jgi:hypothetical protein
VPCDNRKEYSSHNLFQRWGGIVTVIFSSP